MKIVISVDVEEEGLFSGVYRRDPPGVSNVAHLDRLEFLTRDFGLPLTLLATFPVLRDERACQILTRWRERLGAEVGVHLHPWCTPPFEEEEIGGPAASRHLAPDLLDRKLRALVAAFADVFGTNPRSFRMGRFDTSEWLPGLLVNAGLSVDSSVVPLSFRRPATFLAQADPYELVAASPTHPALIEVPITVVARSRRAALAAFRLSAAVPDAARAVWLKAAHHLLAVGIHPTWYPLPAMRAAARIHQRRGGRLLHVFLHSSELMPGATPRFRTEAAVARLIGRLRAFVSWLAARGITEGTTLAGAAASVRSAP